MPASLESSSVKHIALFKESSVHIRSLKKFNWCGTSGLTNTNRSVLEYLSRDVCHLAGLLILRLEGKLPGRAIRVRILVRQIRLLRLWLRSAGPIFNQSHSIPANLSV